MDHPPAPDLERRFGGLRRLYGNAGYQRIRSAHLTVIGLGGVGSWSAEALARSGVGALTLIDLDHVAESNVNRQAHALGSTLGKAKVVAMAERITDINPDCRLTIIDDFLTPENVSSLLHPAPDYIIDAIDDVKAKVALIVHCRQHRLPLITIGGAGGQTDPSRIEVRDLSRTEQEPLLARVRKKLRQEHNFPRGTKHKFGIDAVFSMEPLRWPEDDAGCEVPVSGAAGLNCAGFGSSMCVTAAFGLVAAARVLSALAAPRGAPPPAA